MKGVDELGEVFRSTKLLIHRSMIEHGVAECVRVEERSGPEGLDADFAQLLQPARRSLQIAQSVAVRVLQRRCPRLKSRKYFDLICFVDYRISNKFATWSIIGYGKKEVLLSLFMRHWSKFRG